MTEQTEYEYDVFISYSHTDKEWVHGWLLPRLEAAGLRVCIDFRDFDVGVPSLVNMERAVDSSRRTLLVLTPAWVNSEWTEFEALLTQTTDPAGRRRCLLPLLLQSCQPPSRIAMLTYADFTQDGEWETQLQRVVAAVRGELRLQDVGPQLSRLVGSKESSSTVSFIRNTAVIRDLLGAAFDDEELTMLCYDHFRPAYEEFSAGMSKRQRIQRLLDYCERHVQTEKLLELIQKHNPAQYARFRDQLR